MSWYLEVISSLTDEGDEVPERYRSAGPASDLEVGGGRREGRMETRHPVTGGQLATGTPGSVPATPSGVKSGDLSLHWWQGLCYNNNNNQA